MAAMLKSGPVRWLAVIVVLLSSAGLLAQDSDKYLHAARRFADTAIEKGRDVYGDQHSPLFVDGLNCQTLEPVRWIKGGETWVLCNFASQQPLMRLLDGLTTLTGQAKYRTAAEDAARYAMKNLQGPSGLLNWGGHMAWDLETEKAVGQYTDTHEMKSHEPYYELLWRVDPDATRKLTTAVWSGHILDFSRLDYNRHASIRKTKPSPWDNEFDVDIEVPFPAVGSNLSFVNVTAPLTHAAVSLAILDNDEKPLLWADHLLYRWQQARDSSTGLSGGQLSYRKQDRAQEALGHVHPNINEARIVASYHQTGRYHNLPLAQMQAGERLLKCGGRFAETGRRFIQWASDDLKTYADRCYDADARRFNAMMTDGTVLKWKQTKTGYYVPQSFAPRSPDGFLLWGYATAFRLTGDPSHWEMARNICRLSDLGDIGTPQGHDASVKLKTSNKAWTSLYALLELARATGRDDLMSLACRIGYNLIETQSDNGLFPHKGRKWARTGDEIPLALLHLSAAMDDKDSQISAPIFDGRFFHCEYDGPLEDSQKKRADARTYDHLVFYGD